MPTSEDESNQQLELEANQNTDEPPRQEESYQKDAEVLESDNEAEAKSNHSADDLATSDVYRDDDAESDSVQHTEWQADEEVERLRQAVQELQQFRMEGGAQNLSERSQQTIRDLRGNFNRTNKQQWDQLLLALTDGALFVQTRRIMERRRHVTAPDSELARIVALLLSTLMTLSRDRRVVNMCVQHGVVAHIVKDLADPILVRACVSPSVAKEHFVQVAFAELTILFDAVRERALNASEAPVVELAARFVAAYSDKLRLSALLLLSYLACKHGTAATEIVATRKDAGNATLLLQKCVQPFVRGKRVRVHGFTLQDALEATQDLMVANRGTIAALLDTDFPNWAVQILAAPELQDVDNAGVSAAFVSGRERYYLVKCLETMSSESKARKAFNRKHQKIVHEMTKLAAASNKDPLVQKTCSTFVWQVKFGDVHVMKKQVINSSHSQRSMGKWKK